MGRKRALIVGINYPGTDHALRGCVNDAKAMRELLVGHYGFADTDVKMLLDNDATTANMLNSLEGLVTGAEAGDILFFHYSGHGSQYPNNSGTDVEPDGLDEIICPVDLDWNTKMIRDDDLRRIFDKVPVGVNLTVVLDCCNSGSGLDQAFQYQPLGVGDQPEYSDPVKGGRFLPPPPKVQTLIENRKLEIQPVNRAITNRDVNKTGLLITGCQAHQTSADAYIGGKYMGACTYMLIDVMKSNNYVLPYRNLVEHMNQKMIQYGFTQRPELNGSIGLFDYHFMEVMYPPREGTTTLASLSEGGQVVVSELEAEDDSFFKNKIFLGIFGAVILGAVIWLLSS